MSQPPRARFLHRIGPACVLLLLLGCGRRQPAPDPDEFLREAQDRRLLLSQVVDDPALPDECGILEGGPYKYLLKRCVGVKEGQLKDREEKDPVRAPTCDRLLRQPGLFRGQVVVLRRAVVIEVSQAQAPPEYGLPPGYTILPALLVNSVHELYELRILCPPDSKLFEKLERGIEKGENPVLRVSGFFMKNHCKRTSVAGEPPWRAPLFVCPEPSIERRAGTYNAYRDLVEARMDKYLPSQALEGPKAEARLAVEVLPAGPGADPEHGPFPLRAYGRDGSSGDREFLAQALARLKESLPGDQAGKPSAVVVRTPNAPRPAVRAALLALRDLGVERLFVRDETETLLPDPPPRKPATEQTGHDGG
jgi:hypothetical protein